MSRERADHLDELDPQDESFMYGSSIYLNHLLRSNAKSHSASVYLKNSSCQCFPIITAIFDVIYLVEYYCSMQENIIVESNKGVQECGL